MRCRGCPGLPGVLWSVGSSGPCAEAEGPWPWPAAQQDAADPGASSSLTTPSAARLDRGHRPQLEPDAGSRGLRGAECQPGLRGHGAACVQLGAWRGAGAGTAGVMLRLLWAARDKTPRKDRAEEGLSRFPGAWE